MPSSSDLFKEYLSDVFVETGSYVGDGIACAIKAGFNRIYSIELADKYYNYCIERFSNDPRVTIVNGDSGIMLHEAIKDIDHKITFWLDGHHSCGDTAKGCAWSPLMHELDQISRHSIKSHTIIIDDMICWEKGNPVIGFGMEDIQEKILSINKDYKFFYKEGEWDGKPFDKYILIATI